MLPKVTTNATLGNGEIRVIPYQWKIRLIRPQIASLLGVCDGSVMIARICYQQID
jgi:hypothetical protein